MGTQTPQHRDETIPKNMSVQVKAILHRGPNEEELPRKEIRRFEVDANVSGRYVFSSSGLIPHWRRLLTIRKLMTSFLSILLSYTRQKNGLTVLGQHYQTDIVLLRIGTWKNFLEPIGKFILK